MNEKHTKRYQQLVDETEVELLHATTLAPAEELLSELRVYQVELEAQNEELRLTHAALEKSRDRYVDLYEFAPIGYITISNEGFVTEANLKAATMLGVERKKLIQQRFARFLADQDKDRWYRQFLRMKRAASGTEQDFDLTFVRHDGSALRAHLNCLRMNGLDDSQMLRIGLVDITLLDDLRIAATAFESKEGIMVTDASNTILRVNPAFTEITGYSAEEVIGKNPHLLSSGKHERSFMP